MAQYKSQGPKVPESGLTTFSAHIFLLMHYGAHRLPQPHKVRLPQPGDALDAAGVDITRVLKSVQPSRQQDPVAAAAPPVVTASVLSNTLHDLNEPERLFFAKLGTSSVTVQLSSQSQVSNTGASASATQPQTTTTTYTLPHGPSSATDHQFTWVLLSELLRTKLLTHQPLWYICSVTSRTNGSTAADRSETGTNRTTSVANHPMDDSSAAVISAATRVVPAPPVDASSNIASGPEQDPLNMSGTASFADESGIQCSDDVDGYEEPHIALMSRIACLLKINLKSTATWDTQ
eukprot:GILK01035605.1.p1 GENE.GILK01035605.1~~GILK01035605.1.p1  ORF type:complete len:325 (-),score=5.22 GILK01035605.1:16-888(-)